MKQIIDRPLRLPLSKALLLSIMVINIGCRRETVPPIASFSTSSRMGFTGRVFTFDASESSDPDGDPLTLEYRWDFNSDSQWDTDYSTARIANHVFVKTGITKIRLEVKDRDNMTNTHSDSVILYEPIPDTIFIDSRDNQKYKAVKLSGNWWMAENLRYGTRIHSSEPQTDNNQTEYYAYDDDPSNVPINGGLYSWSEMMDYVNDTLSHQGICPDGWRVPTIHDWMSINLSAPLQFLVDYYGSDGISGFDLQFSGVHETSAPQPPFIPSFWGLNQFGYYWTTSRRFTTAKNTLVTYYKLIAFYLPSTTELSLGFQLHYLGDWYVQTYLDKVYPNTPSASLRCIKN